MSNETTLGFEVRLDDTYAHGLERVTQALKDQGFGILTRIDLHDALREKLGVEFRDYAILGACNPTLAHRAISARPEVGLLLPCNVTVEADPAGGVMVRITDPAALFAASGVEGDEAIAAVVEEAHGLLAKVATTLSEG